MGRWRGVEREESRMGSRSRTRFSSDIRYSPPSPKQNKNISGNREGPTEKMKESSSTCRSLFIPSSYLIIAQTPPIHPPPPPARLLLHSPEQNAVRLTTAFLQSHIIIFSSVPLPHSSPRASFCLRYFEFNKINILCYYYW